LAFVSRKTLQKRDANVDAKIAREVAVFAAAQHHRHGLFFR
jgi:hypothetical protein